MVPDTFIKSKLIELFEKIASFTYFPLGTKRRSRLSINIVLLFILILIIGIIPGIGNRHTNWFQRRTQKKNIGGRFEKIRKITVRPVFKNLAPPGILFMPPLATKKKNNNNIKLIISSIIVIL
jgi:hypothetical protein